MSCDFLPRAVAKVEGFGWLWCVVATLRASGLVLQVGTDLHSASTPGVAVLEPPGELQCYARNEEEVSWKLVQER